MCKYAVVDLEMCHVPEGEGRRTFGFGSELIQIGAVLLDEAYRYLGSYQTYVKPEFGAIDPYIEQLTGIREEDVKDAPDAGTALESFLNWLPQDAVMVSWSNSDRAQIRHELKGKHLAIPGYAAFFETWRDCQRTFGEKVAKRNTGSVKQYRLSEALNIAEIQYEEGAHDALVDAKNTAKLFRKMEREQELKLSPYFVREDQNSSGGYCLFADILSGMTLAG